MSGAAIRVEVTAQDVAFGRNPGEGHNPYWATPVERALTRVFAEQEVSVDGDGALGSIATIGQDEWTLVLDLPEAATAWLLRRWELAEEGEPFAFELTPPDWLVDLIRDVRVTGPRTSRSWPGHVLSFDRPSDCPECEGHRQAMLRPPSGP